jgi:outer membrane biosynthesis protein TonB
VQSITSDRQFLIAGFLFSIIVHVALVLPWLGDEAGAATNEGIADLSQTLTPPPPEEEEAELGLDDSMAKTMNWIGYEEYEEHLARLAETDQAAFQMNPSAGGGAPPPQPQRPETPTPEQDQAKPRQNAAAPPSVSAPQPATSEAAQAPQSDVPTEADRVELTTSKEPDPEGNAALVGPPQPSPEEQPEPSPEPKPEPKPEPEPKPQPKPQPETPPQPQPEPSPTPKPKPEPGEGPGSGEGDPKDTGDAAEQESDPTSVVEVPPDTWRAGKPLAAHGLELKTMRPVLTELTLLTARYGNPLVEIQFGRNGRPRNAKIIESSGDRRVDEPILDSLYRWRAKGKQLEALKGTETINIKLRIVLN